MAIKSSVGVTVGPVTVGSVTVWLVTVGPVTVGPVTVGIVTVGLVTVGTVTVGVVIPMVGILLSLLKTTVSSMTVYPVGLATPVVAPPVVVPVVAPVVEVPVAPVVDPVVATPVVPVPATEAPPFVAMLGVDPPILPKTPNPNNNPKIRANKAKIPNKGQIQLGHPPFFYFVLVSFTGPATVAPPFDFFTDGTGSMRGCWTKTSSLTSVRIGWLEISVSLNFDSLKNGHIAQLFLKIAPNNIWVELNSSLIFTFC